MKISIIVAQSKNRVIGKNNQLPWHLPADLKHFKSVTMGKPIIMGRKTFESIGRPLPGRLNVVISRQADLHIPGCDVFNSIEQALSSLDHEDEVMIIGGANLYAQMLDKADCVYLTIVETEVEGDAFFPELSKQEWVLESEACFMSDDKNLYDYRFQVWHRYGR